MVAAVACGGFEDSKGERSEQSGNSGDSSRMTGCAFLEARGTRNPLHTLDIANLANPMDVFLDEPQQLLKSTLEKCFDFCTENPYDFLLVTNQPDGRPRVRVNGWRGVHARARARTHTQHPSPWWAGLRYLSFISA